MLDAQKARPDPTVLTDAQKARPDPTVLPPRFCPRVSGRGWVPRLPVPGDVDPAADPDAVVTLDVIEKSLGGRRGKPIAS
jgi:hypothetical protein